jgi:16S rRNA (uracil1498-N3)-methyltransferase
MSAHRFFLPANEWSDGPLALTGEEARHCSNVLRCAVGERVAVFDGHGREAGGSIASVSNSEVVIDVQTRENTPRPPVGISLCQAVPKGKNMDLIVQKATELGASRIVPLLSDRTVVRLDGGEIEKKRAKWQRVALEACKQCGQNWLPEVAAPVSVMDFLRSNGNADDKCLRLIAAIDDRAGSLKEILSDNGGSAPVESASIMIGPEGDFTPAELDAAINAGFRPMSLGPIVLRSETAAIYSLSVLVHELMG